MTASTPGHDETFARAAHWLARLEAADCTAAERAAFEDWLAADPAHVHAWAEAEALHQRSAALRQDPWLRASTRRIPARPRHRQPVLRAAIAACLCLALGLGALLALDANTTPHTYVNGGLAPRQQVLEDGSLVVLDAGTTLTARIGWRTRRIELQQGRMQLQVAQVRQPLRVFAGNSTLRDIGTTFQVEVLDDKRIGVALLEGALEIDSRGARPMQHTLQPGEQVQVQPNGRIETGPPLSRQQAEAWLHGELLFDATPLAIVVARMNRYTATPLVIADPAIEALAVSGRFPAGDQAALLSALELGWSVNGRRRTDGTLELHGMR